MLYWTWRKMIVLGIADVVMAFHMDSFWVYAALSVFLLIGMADWRTRSGGVAEARLRDDETAVQVTNWDSDYPRPRQKILSKKQTMRSYTCPVCGSDDPHRYTRCYHAGCPDGRDPR